MFAVNTLTLSTVLVSVRAPGLVFFLVAESPLLHFVYTLCLKKRPHFVFFNNSVKKLSSLYNFWYIIEILFIYYEDQ